jgi:hypothetical protein
MNSRTSLINDPGEENLGRTILRNEVHVFSNENGGGEIFNRNYGEISSGVDRRETPVE